MFLICKDKKKINSKKTHLLEKSIFFLNNQIFPENENLNKSFNVFIIGLLKYNITNITTNNVLPLAFVSFNGNILGIKFEFLQFITTSLNFFSEDKKDKLFSSPFGSVSTTNFGCGSYNSIFFLPQFSKNIMESEISNFFDKNEILDISSIPERLTFFGVKFFKNKFGIVYTTSNFDKPFPGCILWYKSKYITIMNYFQQKNKDNDFKQGLYKYWNSVYLLILDSILLGSHELKIKNDEGNKDLFERFKESLFISINLITCLNLLKNIFNKDSFSIYISFNGAKNFKCVIIISIFTLIIEYDFSTRKWNIAIKGIYVINALKELTKKELILN